MSESKKESMNANNSTIHTADIKSAQNTDFLRLTTDICYVIGGFFGGKLPEGESYMFMNDSDQVVWLDMEEKFILADDRLSRAKMLALETIAFDNDFYYDIYTEED